MDASNSFIWWIGVGLIAGVLAKAITPGSDREPKGCLFTIGLGIVGSVVVGFAMSFIGLTGQGGFWATVVGATIGAVILITLLKKFWK